MPPCKEDYVDQTSQPISFLKSETRGDWSMYDWRGDFQKDGNYNWHLSYQANCPSKLKDVGGHIALTQGWARSVLKSMEWSKRKCTTGKIEPGEQFLLKEKDKRCISLIIEKHEIPKELILNLDQILLSYVSPGKYTFNP